MAALGSGGVFDELQVNMGAAVDQARDGRDLHVLMLNGHAGGQVGSGGIVFRPITQLTLRPWAVRHGGDSLPGLLAELCLQGFQITAGSQLLALIDHRVTHLQVRRRFEA